MVIAAKLAGFTWRELGRALQIFLEEGWKGLPLPGRVCVAGGRSQPGKSELGGPVVRPLLWDLFSFLAGEQCQAPSHEPVGFDGPGAASALLSAPTHPFSFLLSLQVARWEHKTRALSRVCGSPHTACYCLGTVILMLNCVRSHW